MKPPFGCREAVPHVSMEPDAKYARPSYERLSRLRPLTDERIRHYERLGWYQRQQLRQMNGGRLVYSA